MNLSSVSIPYYRFILKDGINQFKKFAVNVWNVSQIGRTDEEIALLGLEKMEQWMKELGLEMNLSKLGVNKDMVETIANSVFILDGGFKVLTKEDIIQILINSL